MYTLTFCTSRLYICYHKIHPNIATSCSKPVNTVKCGFYKFKQVVVAVQYCNYCHN